MRTSLRLALLALLTAVAVNYFEPLPDLLNRLWVRALPSHLTLNEALHNILFDSQQQKVLKTPGSETSATAVPADNEPSTPAPAASSQDRPRGFRRRLVAVGDLHGDFPNAQKVLTMARVIDASGAWSGETDVFVQTGDIVDRGPHTLPLYELIEMLRRQALEVGGQVVSTHGNHEWMNAIGDWRYVSQAEIQTFGGVAERQAMLAKGWVGRAWRDNYTVAARVPLHPSLGPVNTDYVAIASGSALSHASLAVVHGGLAPTYPDLAPFPSRINAIGASLLARLQNRKQQPPPHPPAPYPGLPAGTTPQEERMYGEDGPLWYRGWAHDTEADACAKVDGVLAKLGARRMVMGHTPDFEKIVSRCNAKIIIIDTGISRAYGGALSALEIVYTLTPGADGWLEREVVSAIYESGPVLLADDRRTVQGDFSAWVNVDETPASVE